MVRVKVDDFLDQFDYVMVFPLKGKISKEKGGCCGGKEKEKKEEFGLGLVICTKEGCGWLQALEHIENTMIYTAHPF